jgi:GntR family transcriptional regulator, galactonate operon transcriptional repressor
LTADAPPSAPDGEAAAGTQPMGAPLLPRWPRRPQRLATAVVSDLAERIVTGEFAAGGPLPVEPVLCERFGVSRITIREAVKALEAMRLVEIRQGAGTTVRVRDEWNLLDPAVLAALVAHDDDLAILDEIIRLRCELEGAMATRAATRIDEGQRSTLAGLLAQLDTATADPDRYLDLDVAFHDVIMNASASPLSRAIIATLNTQVFGSGSYIGKPTDADREQSNREHHAILAALLAADGELAARAMSDHIARSWLRRRPR